MKIRTLTSEAVIGMFALAGLVSSAQQAPQQPPPVPSISQRPNGSSLGTIRGGAADNNIWFGWRVAMPAAVLKGLTFSEALAKSDILSLTSVEASSTQLTSPEVPNHWTTAFSPANATPLFTGCAS